MKYDDWVNNDTEKKLIPLYVVILIFSWQLIDSSIIFNLLQIDKKKSKSPEKNVNLQKTQVEVDTPSSPSTHSIGQEVKAVYLVVTTACNTHVY